MNKDFGMRLFGLNLLAAFSKLSTETVTETTAEEESGDLLVFGYNYRVPLRLCGDPALAEELNFQGGPATFSVVDGVVVPQPKNHGSSATITFPELNLNFDGPFQNSHFGPNLARRLNKRR